MGHCRYRTVCAAMVLILAAVTDRGATSAVAQPYAPSAIPPATTRATSTVEPGYLGVLADESGQTTGGIRLINVLAGGPAHAAGLQPGDVITSIDGQTANSVDDMAKLLGGRPAGDDVTFVVRRGNEVRRVEVKLTKRPPPEQRRYGTFGRVDPNAAPPSSTVAGAVTNQPTLTPKPLGIPHPGVSATEPLPVPGAPANAYSATSPLAGVPQSKSLLGVRAVPVVPEIQRSLNLPDTRGALIVEVQPGSPAQKAGLPLEAVIVGIDGLPINSPQDLAQAVSERGAGVDVRLSYFRFGQLTEKLIRLGVGPAPTPLNVPTTSPTTTAVPAPSTTPTVLAPSPNAVPPSVLTPPPANPVRPATVPPVTTPPSTATGAVVKPAATSPPTAGGETEADKLRRQIREMEARLAELEKQPSPKTADKKPDTATPTVKPPAKN